MFRNYHNNNLARDFRESRLVGIFYPIVSENAEKETTILKSVMTLTVTVHMYI